MDTEIPGPAGKFLIGSLRQFDARHFHVSMFKWMEDHGPIYQFRIFRRNIIVLSDLDLMEKAFSLEDLNHRPNNFSNKLRYGGNGAVFSNFTEKETVFKGLVWGAMSEMHEDEVLSRLVDIELDEFISSLDTEGNDIDMSMGLLRSMANQMSAKYLGTKPSIEHCNAMLEYLNALNGLYEGGRETLLTMLPFLRYIPGRLRRIVNDLCAKQKHTIEIFLKEAKSSYVKGEEHGLVHRLMTGKDNENTARDDDYITDDNIHCCLLELIISSITPLSSCTNGVLLSAIVNPEMQEKIYLEIQNKDPDFPLTNTELIYFQAFVLESIRYFTFVTITFPRNVSKDTIVDEYLFKKDSLLLGSLYNLHHDQKIWGDPWTFRPERFLGDSGELLPVTDEPMRSLQIFGFKPRDCKARSTAMVMMHKYLIRIFREYKVLPPVGMELPPFDPRKYETVTVVKMPQFYCRFEKRGQHTESSRL